VTLPTKTPAIGPCPRLPATITSAATSRAVSAIMCAACVRDAGDELERGVKAHRLELVHLVTDLGLEVALVREERIAARFPDEDFVAVDDGELPSPQVASAFANGKASSAVSEPSVAQMMVLDIAVSFRLLALSMEQIVPGGR
jgi:hypothetical protein